MYPRLDLAVGKRGYLGGFMENKVKHLIGTVCPQCKLNGMHGTLRKKYNRQVKPAKPFLGCSRYPACDYSLEMNGKHLSEETDYDDPLNGCHPHSPDAHDQW
jgi:ssDNA-binding Zn-finger/Zn-ribbon topoisomerase 1